MFLYIIPQLEHNENFLLPNKNLYLHFLKVFVMKQLVTNRLSN